MQKEILALNRLAQKFARKNASKRVQSLFDRYEVKFDIDEKGQNRLARISKVSKEANKLIEEFMLLANRTVGRV